MFLVFDLETTGLSTTSCDIIQLAYCMFDTNNNFVKAENLYFYYEGMSWSQEVADKSHQISLDFLKQYKDKFEENVIKTYALFNRANVIGHNSDHFDCPFLKSWLARQGLPEFQFGIKQDTMKAFKPVTKRARIKLTKLSELMNVSESAIRYFAEMWFGASNLRGPHDAAYDVTATALLTLQGLSKGYINFSNLEEAEVSDSYEIEAYEDTTAVSKPMDPDGFIVLLGDDDTVKPYWVNHDKNKYTVLDIVYDGKELEDYMRQNLSIPIVLSKVSDSSYVGNNGILSYTLNVGDCDTFTISTPYFTKSDTEMNIKEHITNTYHSGGAK